MVFLRSPEYVGQGALAIDLPSVNLDTGLPMWGSDERSEIKPSYVTCRRPGGPCTMFVHPASGTQTFQSEPRILHRVIDWAEQKEIGASSCRTTTRLSLAPDSPGRPWRGDWWLQAG